MRGMLSDATPPTPTFKPTIRVDSRTDRAAVAGLVSAALFPRGAGLLAWFAARLACLMAIASAVLCVPGTALLWALAPVVALAAEVAPQAATATTATAAAAAGDAHGVGGLQFGLAAVALGNFLLSVSSFYLARHRVTTDKLNQLEVQMRSQFAAHGERIAGLAATAESAITHDHLAEVYGDIKGIAAQINNLAGQQQQMNDNLRLMLARLTQA